MISIGWSGTAVRSIPGVLVAVMLVGMTTGLIPLGATTPVNTIEEPRVDRQTDTLNLFVANVSETVSRLVAYNDTVAAYRESVRKDDDTKPTAQSSNNAEIVLGGYFGELLGLDVVPGADPANLPRVRTLSNLSFGLQGHNSSLIFESLFGSEFDRIRQGLLIRSLPMSLPLEGATITSGFGMRNHPILRGRRMHTGLDMAAPTGTEILATGAGVVTFAGRKGGYGNAVVIDHGHGYTTLFAHCTKLLVEEGAKVSRGDLIALVGSTGRSTGPHLHYEVRVDGQHMNPTHFLVYGIEQIDALEELADQYLTL